MRPRENYTPFFAVGLGLTLVTLAILQAYILREPARIQADVAADLADAVAAGGELYAENCTSCHGRHGEGQSGPALNSRELLKTTTDEALVSIIRTGVPGTNMPAWGQAFGGPFTDEEMAHLAAFMRAWEPTAPEITPEEEISDPVRGATLFASSCFTCHGENGQGTSDAPALNDPERLEQFDDAWYRATIANGRPAKGMPTWGTVLSPEQINDLVALIDAWREGQTIRPDISILNRISSALYAIRQFDRLDAAFHLSAALGQASGSQVKDIQAALDLVEDNRLFEAEALLITLFPPEEMGKELFATNCASCHGADGTGNTAPNLHNNGFIQANSDEDLVTFVLTGRPGTAMDGFEGILREEDVSNLIALLRTWQE
jgi:cytochrome c oxidase cbb3-type subunit 3